jgi:chromosome segregation ATPase
MYMCQHIGHPFRNKIWSDIVLQAWQSAVPRDVLEGLLASEDLRKSHNLEGVMGCLVDLVEVPPQLVTAADVVAGNQLFQVGGKAVQL